MNRVRDLLTGAGFTELDLAAPFPEAPGRYLVARGGFLTAWVRTARPVSGYVIVAGHSDSPGLRVKPAADLSVAGVAQLGVEIYGAPLFESWLDRDLGLAGRVTVRTPDGLADQLVLDDRPILRIPRLAIHLRRDIDDGGGQKSRLDAQYHMTPMWALTESGGLRRYLAERLDVPAEAVLAFDLMPFDTQEPAAVGRDGDLLASGRLDNLLSCFTGARALIAAADAEPERVPALCLFDHEETGSLSATGAFGDLAAHVLERVSASAGRSRPDHLAALAASVVVSSDCTHATHPNYPGHSEPAHPVRLGGGVVIKRNASQRYATDGPTEAYTLTAAADAGVPTQWFVSRNDMPCGTTIGPLTAARLAVPTVDVGAPILSMHSARETAAVADVGYLTDLFTAMWTR